MKIVTYQRVSTARQGNSGLGLEAQKQAIDSYVQVSGSKIIASFTEVESGSSNNRPELLKALRTAKATGATLIIAKLDRLSRNAAFLLTLQDSGVKFIAADMPDANNLTVGIMALVAQQEREAISKRTKEALQAAKLRGVKLGNPNGAAALIRAGKGNTAGLRAIKKNANEYAFHMEPILNEIKSNGHLSLGQIATELNRREILTPRGGTWHKTTVKNLMTRIKNNQITI